MNLTELTSLFEANACDSNAREAKRYMKNIADFYGIKQPVRKKLSKEFIDEALKIHKQEIEKLVWQLWMLPEREFQYVAIDLLDRFCKKARPESIDIYEKLIITKSWWDSVDMVAQKHVGSYFQLFPQQIIHYTTKWVNSDNMWLQRTAILFQNRYNDKTDEKLLFVYCARFGSSKEFFIQKAIGWALRTYSETNPEAVKNFVAETQLAPLSRREALRKIK